MVAIEENREKNRTVAKVKKRVEQGIPRMGERQKSTHNGIGVDAVTLAQAAHPIRIEDDFNGWLLDQAAALRKRKGSWLDWDHLAEELEAMAAQHRREIKKHLKKLLEHLLKFHVQPNQLHRHHSWRTSVREAREEISDLIEESPGIFQGKEDEFVAVAYKRARERVSDQTRIALRELPEECPWSFDEIMRDDFFANVPQLPRD